jgi:hypothetical protein
VVWPACARIASIDHTRPHAAAGSRPKIVAPIGRYLSSADGAPAAAALGRALDTMSPDQRAAVLRTLIPRDQPRRDQARVPR